MQIAKLDIVPLDGRPRYPQLTASDSKSMSFSNLMHQVMDDKTGSAQEASHQKQLDSSCDCGKSEKNANAIAS